MTIDLQVYANSDHACLVWIPSDEKPIKGCLGFAIERDINGKTDFLHGFVGFSADAKPDSANPWKFPVQRFVWCDYHVQIGQTVKYRVIPVMGDVSNVLTLATSAASAQKSVTISAQASPHISAFFNKGIVAAQWVSRALDNQPSKSKITPLIATPGNELRNALSGQLRPEILKRLSEARAKGWTVYAALYELNDRELIDGLVAFGKKCNLILANGAFKSNKAPDNDENVAVRRQLKTKVTLYNRIVKKGHFAHNKFVVFCDAADQAKSVLSGSTNWTSTGLCTQANNALIIDDETVAQDFLEAWQRLKAARNDYPSALVTGNSKLRARKVDGYPVTPWFVKTSAAQDLQFARKLISSAKEAILFLFFNPGIFQTNPKRWTLLQNILARHNERSQDYKPDLYFCGVVNQDIPMLTKPGSGKAGKAHVHPALDPTTSITHPVTLYRDGVEPPMRLSHDVLIPHNIKSQYYDWVKELLGASMVNIHSKVIVLDPFGKNPVVMTGSHNLGFKASNANDDNLVIVQGNAKLAQAYAINIVAIYQNYRWNSYVEAHRKDKQAWHRLEASDQWQASYLSGSDLAELQFWLGRTPAGSATAGVRTAAPGTTAARSGHQTMKAA